MRTPLIAFCLLVAVATSAETIRVPLLLEDSAGCRITARRAERLAAVPTANGQGAIVIDALRPTRWSSDPEGQSLAQEPQPVVADKTSSCGCGAQAARPNSITLPEPLRRNFLRYDFHVRQPGTYSVFVKVMVPPGRFNFVETLDGRRYSGPQREENTGKEPLARWIQRPNVRLTPGLHRFCLAGSGYGLPGVLSIVFAPSSAAAPSGDPPPVVLQNVDSCEIRTMPMSLPGVRSVKAVQGAGTDVPLEWSVAESEQRQSMPAGGLAIDRPVRFHFTLDAAHPRVGPLTADLEVTPGAVIRLQQGGTELLLEGRTGDFLMLYDRAADRLLAGTGLPQPMLALQFKRAGEARWTQVAPDQTSVLVPKKQHAVGPWHLEPVSSAAQKIDPELVRVEDITRRVSVEVITRSVSEVEGQKATIRHIFSAEGLGRARVTQTIMPDGDRVWRLAAEVESLSGPGDVVGVIYPRLPAVRIGESGLDDVQLRLMSFGHRRVHPGREPLPDASYCGRVVMNWTQIYDSQASLYLGAHDPAGTTTVHASEASGPDGEAVGLSMRRLDEIRPGSKITWETRLAVGDGGWHKGARLYGDWFTSVHGPADYPAWLRSSPGWIDLQAENYPGFRFVQISDWLTHARAIGLDWVQVWGQFGYDVGPCCCAWYGLSPTYGGLEGWRTATAEIRRRGGHVGGYFIYDQFDRLPVELGTFLGRYEPKDYGPTEPWDSAAFQHEMAVVTDPSGVVPPLKATETHRDQYKAQVAEHRKLSAEHRPAKPVQWWQVAYVSDPRWRDYLATWIGDRYVGAWGANTSYVDVMGTGDATIDYDPRRQNNGDGSWGLGRKWLAKEVLERARRHDPSFGLSMEGLGDLPGVYAAAMCSGVYQGHRNVVRYAFPDRILIHGLANFGGQGTGGPLARYLTTFREAMRWDIVGRATALPVSLLNLTRPFLPELYQARFLDTEGLAVSDPRIEARHFDATRTALGCHLITLTNEQRVDGEVVLTDSTLCRAGTVLGLTLDGRTTKTAIRPGEKSLRIGVDHSALAAIYLVPAADAVAAPVWPVLWADWSRTNEDGRLALLLFNLGNRMGKVAADVQCLGYTEPLAERLPGPSRVQHHREVGLEPYQIATVGLPSPAEAVGAWRQWTTRWAVSLPGTGQRREFLLTPTALDPSFELLGEGDAQGVAGRALELGPSTDGFQHRLVDLWLLPATGYRLRIQAKRSGFKADVLGVLLRLNKGDGADFDDHRWPMDRKRPNEWQPLGGEFTTPPDLTRASLYLYNVRSPDTAWFDDLQIERLP